VPYLSASAVVIHYEEALYQVYAPLPLPLPLTNWSRSVLNAAARLVFRLKCSDHITDALVSVHWLRLPERIHYKVAVLDYRVLHGSAPRYQGPLTRVADIPCFSRHQSSDLAVGQTPLSAAEPFRLPLLPSGTHSRITSSVHQLYSHFSIT